MPGFDIADAEAAGVSSLFVSASSSSCSSCTLEMGAEGSTETAGALDWDSEASGCKGGSPDATGLEFDCDTDGEGEDTSALSSNDAPDWVDAEKELVITALSSEIELRELRELPLLEDLDDLLPLRLELSLLRLLFDDRDDWMEKKCMSFDENIETNTDSTRSPTNLQRGASRRRYTSKSKNRLDFRFQRVSCTLHDRF